MPNSETKRPARMSQLCQGSCDPCQTFPRRIDESILAIGGNLLAGERLSSATLTLMEVTVFLVGRGLAKTAVRGAAVVLNVAETLYDGRKQPFVYVPCREGSLAEIGLFVRVV